jgi:hypothetical protein
MMNQPLVMSENLLILHQQYDHVELFMNNHQSKNQLLFEEKLFGVIIHHRKMLLFIVHLLVQKHFIMLIEKVKCFLKIVLHHQNLLVSMLLKVSNNPHHQHEELVWYSNGLEHLHHHQEKRGILDHDDKSILIQKLLIDNKE